MVPKVRNHAIRGLWYVSNGAKLNEDVRYLWKNDLQWHESTVDDYLNYDHNDFHMWPGYFLCKEDAELALEEHEKKYGSESS